MHCPSRVYSAYWVVVGEVSRELSDTALAESHEPTKSD